MAKLSVALVISLMVKSLHDLSPFSMSRAMLVLSWAPRVSRWRHRRWRETIVEIRVPASMATPANANPDNDNDVIQNYYKIIICFVI